MADLIVKNETSSHTYEMQDGKPLFAGRTAECDICLPSPAVSRRHAVFLSRNGEYGVKDMGSVNGTYLNGKKITKAMRLMAGDIIQIAGFIIEFNAPREYAEDSEKTVESVRRTTIFQGRITKSGGAGVQVSHTPFASSPPPQQPTPDKAEVAFKPFAVAEEDKDGAVPSPVFEPQDAVPEAEAESVATVEVFDEDPFLSDDSPAPLPELAAAICGADFSEDEIGDGSDDAAFLMESVATEDDPDAKADALTKAAAEAGIVGEFMPEPEDEASDSGDGTDVIYADGGEVAVPPDYVPNPDAIPIDSQFRQAIENRLLLYSFLNDMKMERERFIAKRPVLADPVKSELDRQDRELDKIPSPEQAENMIEKRRARQKDLAARIKQAAETGEAAPAKPSRDMREAEEMAISQWTFCAHSGREALPVVYSQGFRLMADEPLAPILEKSGINPVAFLGGAAYYLALEVLTEETKANRQQLRARLANAPAPNAKRSGGRMGGVFGFFGKGARDDSDEDEENAEEPKENYEELAAMEQTLAARTGWINQELVFVEKNLIQEFWRIYTECALAFLPRHEEMPLAVRAFLRHGVVGFKKWWMKPEVREHIVNDCTNDVVHHMRVGRKITNILYADEYLAAVMNLECTPAMDENLEINERNSPNWKADKALRRLINARSQSVLLEELIGTLEERIAGLNGEVTALDDKISKLLTGSKNYKQVKSELGQQRQAYKVETTKLTNLANKIRNETLASLKETAEEVEERFASGELPKPGTEFLIRRECDAVHKIARLLANLKERFMPLVVRDYFHIDTDAVNDRPAIGGELADMERRDPAMFLEIIVDSKKRANRVDIRVSPVVAILPSAGVLAFSWNPRQKPEDGRLGIPTCFIRRRIRERQLTYLLADFRWDTSKAAAGMDVMTSDTIVAAFMTVRWDWRKRSREAREKGLIYTDQNDRTNWRRVYEAYMQTAYDSGKKLYNRNYDFYERIIAKYFDMPEDVPVLRK